MGSASEDDKFIDDTLHGDPEDVKPRPRSKRSRYTMSGALETQATVADKEAKSPPNRTLFQETSTPPAKSQARTTPRSTEKTTWAQWLKSIVPDSVKKPVSLFVAPTKKKDIFLSPKTPPKTTTDDTPLLPGSFDKDEPYINPNILAESQQSSPSSRSPDLFSYNRSASLSLSPPNKSRGPRRNRDPSSVDTPGTPSRSVSQSFPAPTATPVSAFRKPSNFIERMRSTRRTDRYNPYSRGGSARKTPQKGASILSTGSPTNGSRELTAEEELERIEKRERDRRVQEQEDKYMKREVLRKLGKPVDDDETLEVGKDSVMKEFPPSPVVEEVTDEDEVTLPMPQQKQKQKQKVKTPAKRHPAVDTPGAGLVKETAPQILFGHKSPAPVPTFLSSSPPSAQGPDAMQGSFSSSDSEKENRTAPSRVATQSQSPIPSQPPPPPSPSHRHLPTPSAPLEPSIQPPPISGGPSGIFSAPAPASPVASPSSPINFAGGLRRGSVPGMKHQPRVPSSLSHVENLSHEKENDENSVPSMMKGGSSSSSSSAQQPHPGDAPEKQRAAIAKATGTPSSGFAGARLMERQSNEGRPGIKVDVRAKVAAVSFDTCFITFVCSVTDEYLLQLPTSDIISEIIQWPAMPGTFGDSQVKDAIRGLWTAEWAGDFANPFAGVKVGAISV